MHEINSFKTNKNCSSDLCLAKDHITFMELTYSNTFTAWLSAFSDGYFQFFLLLRPH